MVGRLEIPKDPHRGAFAHLALEHPDEPWTLEIIGPARSDRRSSSRSPPCPQPLRTASRSGAGSRPGVAAARERSGVFDVTSHAGYEGFPRVLVEAMATGLPAVVTEGDTGGLVQQGVSGFLVAGIRERSPTRSETPEVLTRAKVVETVADLSAPSRGAGCLLQRRAGTGFVKVLVTGIAGFVGSTLAQRCRWRSATTSWAWTR